MKTLSSLKDNCLLMNISRQLVALMIFLMLLPPSIVNAHTPYAQWDAYRIRHLQILTTRSDLTGDAVADEWVAILAAQLPQSNAVVSRARNFVRMASLLKTDQAKVAVLSHADAKAMFKGTTPFEEYGPIELQILVDDGTYLLVTRTDLPESHGYMIVSTLLDEKNGLKLSVPTNGVYEMKLHAGAIAFLNEH